MQEELRQLYGQVQQQQQRIVELHNQLVQLGGENFKPAPKPVPASQWISENFIGLRIIHPDISIYADYIGICSRCNPLYFICTS